MAPENPASLRTKSMAASPQPRKVDALIALRYEEAVPAKPPIPVTVAPPREAPTELHPAFRRPLSSRGNNDDSKRDSGLAPTTSSKAREESVNTAVEEEGCPFGVAMNFNSTPEMASVPQSHTQTSSVPSTHKVVPKSESSGSLSRWKRPGSRKNTPPKTPPATGQTPDEILSPTITTSIPTDSLLDADFLDKISFSKRGSMMLAGKKAINGHARPAIGRRQPTSSLLASPTVRVLPDDLEKESQKVRSMYESGPTDWQDGIVSMLDGRPRSEGEAAQDETATYLSPLVNGAAKRPESAVSTTSLIRREHELAGGIEDWEDISGQDVDRYGFFNMKEKPSRPGTPEPRSPQRVSTVLQQASEVPRQKRGFGRSPSSASKSGFKRAPSRKVSARSLHTQASSASNRSSRSSPMRAAANRLPGNRDRRWVDEAGDMLTLPPGLADIAEDEEGGKAAESMKRKEWERAEKWRKMARVVKAGKAGEGMEFEFDTRNPKLIERTWKGIPDRWRSAAWHSFLSTSAKKRKDSATDEEIIEMFQTLQQQSSADDVQIDIDVPRTINSHIMFRRRYRGGQRLLFRVLHALSLYFPNTGYVQGMASLAATLLCYYDEERTFVMLVRLWTLRGLDKLYEPGFSGLMAALDEFQKQWLDGNDVSKKLAELSIEPTAYGTRWYLTLFNYSIPFPAQLRVWDVFMLLGDSDVLSPPTNDRPFGGGLDVLHATSAALIDGTREILLDSDFENAMKVLTSWIPVKDEELLMKVAKAEWKVHRKRRA